MTFKAAESAQGSEPGAIARRFVRARLRAAALSRFPGELPAEMAGAYRVQDAAIALWPDEIAGWKVGRIAAELHEALGAERLAGPIFSGMVVNAGEGPVPFPVFVGGFAAVEGEFVYRIGEDAPPGRTEWTAQEAQSIAETMLVGVEAAGSPLAAINALGPLAVVSDFGNNAGLILGPEIPGWRARRIEDLTCETFIDGAPVGGGAAASLPGGPAAALAFLLGHCARRGRPVRAGTLVSTGATTGIHDIRAGQTARISFGEVGEIVCIAQAARPHPDAGGDHGDDHG